MVWSPRGHQPDMAVAFLVLAFSLLAACSSGDIGQPHFEEYADPDYRPPGAQPPGTDTPPTNNDRENPPVPPEEDPTVCELPSQPLRRLSHDEYRNTLAQLFPDRAIPDVQLPADDRPFEFNNDAERRPTSTDHVEAYNNIARIIAEESGDIESWVECEAQDEACGRRFIEEQGARIFRRPLAADEVDAFAGLLTVEIEGATFQHRLQLILQALLSAPPFLYLFEGPASEGQPGEMVMLEPYALASKLSYFFWMGPPDDELLAAAADGTLSTEDGVRAQVERLAADQRSRGTFARFHEQWLHFDKIYEAQKRDDDNLTPELRDAMVDQSERFIDHIYEENGTIADLFTSRVTIYNAELAPLYGLDAPSEEWATAEVPGRVGLFTHPTFLAAEALPDRGSIAKRGSFVLGRVLCDEPPPPPPSAEAEGALRSSQIEGELTNRERFDLVTAEEPCFSCHVPINAIGGAFENYDTMGRWQETESNGLAIDASGQLDDFAYDNAVEFMEQLAGSDQVEACVVQKWTRFAYAGSAVSRKDCLTTELQDVLAEGDGSMRSLQVAIATHPWFYHYVPPAEEQ